MAGLHGCQRVFEIGLSGVDAQPHIELLKRQMLLKGDHYSSLAVGILLNFTDESLPSWIFLLEKDALRKFKNCLTSHHRMQKEMHR